MAYRKEPKPPKSPSGRRKRLVVALLILILLAGGGIWYLYRQFQIQTAPVIRNAKGTSREMVIPQSETKHFDQGFFGFDLPSDWKLIQQANAPYSLFSYQSTLKNADNRYLDIYADSVPVTMAVNKAVAVKSQGGNLSHGLVSENCTEFMSGANTPGSVKQLAVPAKWDGVEFLCDNDSKTRNVVGTGSVGNINKVVLKGASGSTHSFFFVYTDNNYTPDYTIFYKMLDSFTVK